MFDPSLMIFALTFQMIIVMMKMMMKMIHYRRLDTTWEPLSSSRTAVWDLDGVRMLTKRTPAW